MKLTVALVDATLDNDSLSVAELLRDLLYEYDAWEIETARERFAVVKSTGAWYAVRAYRGTDACVVRRFATEEMARKWLEHWS